MTTTHPPCVNCGGSDYHARGLCHTCYAGQRRRELGAHPRLKKGERTCDLCPSVHYAKGLCVQHYRQQHPYVRAQAKTGPRRTRSDKGQPKPRPSKPASNLPAGWDRPTAARLTQGTDRGAMRNEFGAVPPTAPWLITAALDTLAARDALDLADMLGLCEVAA